MMKGDGRIPVVAGVTGHRDLRDEDREILKEAVKGELRALQAKCPHSPLLVMTSLAEGADQLCAEAALETGLEIISVLPMPLAEYARDFEGEAFEKLMRLTDASSEVLVTPELEDYDERFGTVRSWRYRQAGLYVGKHSHVLIALWDGSAGSEVGCGTASMVDAAMNGSFGESRSRKIHPDDRTVIQIVTPRRSGAAEGLTAGGVKHHTDIAALEGVLRDTEAFNDDVKEHGMFGSDAKESEDPVTERLRRVYDAADSMSLENAAKHRKLLAGLSIAATLLAMAFLLYDEAEWHWMIIFCGLLIGAAFLINNLSAKSRFQARYLEYRVLAEALRVQIHLRTAGVSCEVSEMMPWNMQLAMPWIRNAVSACMTGPAPAHRSSVRESWVIDQRDYHQRALEKSIRKLKKNDRIISIALVMTLVIYAFALVYEIGWGGIFGTEPAFPPEVNYAIRMYIKIAMGTAAAGTLFASNYYGKQALPNVIDDHRKMAALYQEAAEEIDRLGEKEELLISLAEDELTENANWYAYQSKSEPDLGI